VEFKHYISTLFYLQESIKYLEPCDQKTSLENTVSAILEKAYRELNYPSLKLYKEIKDKLQNVSGYYSIKHQLKKTELLLGESFYENLKNNQTSELSQDFHYFGGIVTFAFKVYESNPTVSMHSTIQIIKPKEFCEKEFNEMIETYEQMKAQYIM
jgi:hypothetical protein